MPFTLADLFIAIIAVSTMGAFIVLLQLAVPVRRAAQQLEGLSRYFNSVRPNVDRLIHDAERELAALRQVTHRADGIAADLKDLSGSARRLALPLVTQWAAVAAGAKAGLEALHRLSRVSAQVRDKDGRR